METNSIIVRALAASAAAAFRPHNLITKEEKAMDKSYVAFKQMLRQRYPQVDVDILDIAPGSEERRQLLEGQLVSSGANDDAQLAQLAQSLLNEVIEHEPQAAMGVGLVMPGSPY